MMKNILLIGLGRFGKQIAIQSSQLGHEIKAVDLHFHMLRKHRSGTVRMRNF